MRVRTTFGTCSSSGKLAGLASPGRASATRRAGANVAARAAGREMWYPGAEAPSHLNGTLLGDYGFDPLRLGTDPERLKYFREAELMNGRWAMMAVLGIVFTDAWGLPNFVEAGALDYGINKNVLVGIEVIVMGYFEYKRIQNYQKTGECSLLGAAPFDPLNLKSEETKLKELKNARLGMLAFLGICSQYAVRGLGPVACLKLHLEDPGHNNIFTSAVGPECVCAVVALSLAPMIIEFYKSFETDEDEDDFRPIPF